MKTIGKFFKSLFFEVLLVLGLTVPAEAQQGTQPSMFSNTAVQMHPDALSVHTAKFYHPFVYPHVGEVAKNVPSSRYSFVWNNYPFYYADGLFYQSYADGSFKIAAPPIGAEVPLLPIGAQIINIDGYPYYQYKGVYYDSVFHPGADLAYKVVGKDGIPVTENSPESLPLIGDMTDQLPFGTRRVRLSGKTYWVTPDDVYMEEVTGDKRTSYRVVSIPEKKSGKAVTDQKQHI
jgi:hypothetical protein